MTNLEWLKQKWIRQIRALSVDEVYELLTDGTIHGSICGYCKKIFPLCKDTLNSDKICRKRFKIMCGMEHSEEESSDVDI